MPLRKYPANHTFDCYVHKYTLNIPMDVWHDLEARTAWGSEFNNQVSKYVLLAIHEKLYVNERLATPDEVRQAEASGHTFCPDPPKKHLGFTVRLTNPFSYRKFLSDAEGVRTVQNSQKSC